VPLGALALLSAVSVVLLVCGFESTTGRTVAWVPWTDTLTSRVSGRDGNATLTAIGFVIMTSKATRELFLAQKRTWLRDADRNTTAVWAFSDAYDPLSFDTYTLPSLYGKGGTWADAQHHQLRGMQWLERTHRVPEAMRWLMLIDDDTWVNRPMLERFVAPLDPALPMLCGHEHVVNHVFNGGAGLLLSRPAFDAIASRLYTKTCPFQGTNDNTITACARTVPGLVRMHSARFAFYPPRIESPVDFLEQITIHPVKDADLMRAMTRTTRAFYAASQPTGGM
jgi:hypothetical protein